MSGFDPTKHPRGGDPRNTGRFSPRRPSPPERLGSFTAIAPEMLRFRPLTDAEVAALPRMRVERAIARYRARIAHHAFSDAALEGSTFTLPEVETLLLGTVPEGKSRHEVDQVLSLADGSELLIGMVESGRFDLAPAVSDRLHEVVGAAELIHPGFRRHHEHGSRYQGAATVRFPGGEFHGYPIESAECAQEEIHARLDADPDPVSRALNYAAAASYAQFYGDANKRTARYMMNGVLLANGYDAVEVPERRRADYMTALVDMYRSGDLAPYVDFLYDVAVGQVDRDRRPGR